MPRGPIDTERFGPGLNKLNETVEYHMTPPKRLGQPFEVAHAVLFLASDVASYAAAPRACISMSLQRGARASSVGAGIPHERVEDQLPVRLCQGFGPPRFGSSPFPI
jgi:NAD(P)-dependent dehydrogenase (short-subunit alcohol dehydrogenase family)